MSFMIFTISAASYLYMTPSALAAYASYYFYPPPPILDPTIAPIQRRAFRMGGSRPVCPMYGWHAERYADLRNTTNVFLAVNFYNNEDILPTFFQELPVLVRHLGPERVFVSVYENGSQDSTPEMLALLDDLLAALRVPHQVVYSAEGDISRKERGHRIEVLANVRNRVLAPLYSGAAAVHVPGGSFDDLLFMNDIAFCAADMLELLHEKRAHGANQVCALDWVGAYIYDNWVLRTMRGTMFYMTKINVIPWLHRKHPYLFRTGQRYALLDSDADKARLARALPLQVFSCWDGATAFDAAPFAAPGGIRFRMARADRDDAGQTRTITDLASESFLSSVDMWKAGRGRIMVVPKASVAYDYKTYRLHRKDYVEPPPYAHAAFVWQDTPPAQVAMLDYGNWTQPIHWAPWDEQ
ncbi:cryptococcal mannosyltransferase 1-domain-containing protein [Vararia minispora EC-137]|uniref:Cryptococcal mannosyltransferase 1-domain-containing protein n=1 Tax=Vararia minispora EC-137 TaxID=1314806 RepID=A0ACB8QX81_9AGAM|nr:cryptococcal mannosyltransferase 1-domain-containing protein [Vararia minispora EC-137]